MTKLLAISVALLSLDLYGADRPKYSLTGLEGIGKEGMRIDISGSISKALQVGDPKVVENQIELKLRLAEIKVDNDTKFLPWLEISALHIGAETQKDYIFLKASRLITYEANGIKYTMRAIVWGDTAISNKDGLREPIHELMDRFLLDYLKANPKKEKE